MIRGWCTAEVISPEEKGKPGWGTVIGQNGLADAQLGPSINLSTARWTAMVWAGSQPCCANETWTSLEIELKKVKKRYWRGGCIQARGTAPGEPRQPHREE